jgi:hypothetical protein
VAGPWFTVHRTGGDWLTNDTIWISNGGKSCKAVVQTKVEFTDASTANYLAGDPETLRQRSLPPYDNIPTIQ